MPGSLADYDEDLNQNPFFRTFVQNYLDLFSQCVLERWLICVPRRDSLPQHGRFTIDDFTHHILKPLNQVQELNYIGSNGNEENDRDSRNGHGHGNWSSFDYGSVIGTATDADGGPSILGTAEGESIASIAGSSSSRSDSLNDNDADAFSCDTRKSGSSRRGPRTPCRQYRKWNFETLSGCKIAYDYNTLFLDDDPRPHSLLREPEDFLPDQLQSRSHPRIMRVLFEETFYTTDKQKYKVLCVSAPLNARVEDALYGTTTGRTSETAAAAETDEGGDTEFLSSQQRLLDAQAPSTDSGDWTLCSLRDCIDFIWLNGRRRALETYDGFIKLFLHNHKVLDDLPLRVQRDLVADVYQKCICAALKPGRKKKLKNVEDLLSTGTRISSAARGQATTTATVPTSDGLRSLSASRLSSEEVEDTEVGLDIPSLIAIAQAEDAEALDAQKHERFVANFKLATETYILNALYRPLIHALSSALSVEDAKLNKILRNLADIQPKDLHINEAYWDGFGRAKLELSRIANLGSPLAKLDALKRTMNQLKLDPKLNARSATR